jgi:hypothetical protein
MYPAVLAEALRAAGTEAATAVELGLAGRSDPDLLGPGDSGQGGMGGVGGLGLHGEAPAGANGLALDFGAAPYADLAAAYDNIGISDNSDEAAADLDGVGDSYSAQELTAGSRRRSPWAGR